LARILVTGGAGYLGSVLCRMLLEKGYQVRILDRLYFGEKPLEGIINNPNLDCIRGDIRRLEDFPHLLDDVDAIVHLAGLANDPSCDLDPEMSLDVNITATRRLAQRAKQSGIERFVFSSSCSVYGHGEVDLLTEGSDKKPVSIYAVTKLTAERELSELADDKFVPVILRNATLFGPSPRMRFDLAVNQMVARAVKKGKVLIFEGGRQWRPFLHVEDAARACTICLEAPADKVRAEIFNVGRDDNNFQIADLAQLVKGRFPAADMESVPGDEDRRSYRVSFGKIEKVLGFGAEHSVEDGLEQVRRMFDDGIVDDPEADVYFNVKLMLRLREMPAMAGGESSSPRYLPFVRPSIGEEEECEVLDTLRSGWLTTGPKVERFERSFGQYVGAPCAVAVSSCTAALHLSLVAAGIGPDDEVITSPLTWPATANVVIHQGATPVFVDVDRDTLNIDPDQIEQAVTPKTKAIIPVHIAGLPCEMDAILAVAKKHGLSVIEDAAHALGAEYRGKMIGAISEFSCFSFYPIKNITTIEGGMITVAEEQEAERLRVLSNFGMSKDAWKRYSKERPSGFHPAEVVCPGYKYNMTDVQASLGLHQLEKLPGFLSAREKYAQIYDRAFADVDEIALPGLPSHVKHARHLYIIVLDVDRLTISRNEFVDALKAENIGTGIHFVSLHLHEYYRERFGYGPDDFPNANYLSERILSLPLYPRMSEKNVHDVIVAVKKIINYTRK